jgi:threonyl-tRNA synthetase
VDDDAGKSRRSFALTTQTTKAPGIESGAFRMPEPVPADRRSIMIDHRRLGRELELFGSDPLIGAGLPLWLPDGATARHAVEEYLRRVERAAGYRHVYSPPMGRRELYEISGHWAHFAEDMFPPMRDGGEELVLRPSLCPHHALVYRSRQRSFRDLPLRVAELGGMYRAERSGVLSGLARVRAISLNDAHIFSPMDRVGEEVAGVLELMRRAHAALGVVPARLRLSLRGPDRDYAGDAAQWDHAEGLLRDALAGMGTCRSQTRPAASRPWRPCRSTCTNRPGSTCPMWTRPAGRRGRSWCTAAWWAAWSGCSVT